MVQISHKQADIENFVTYKFDTDNYCTLGRTNVPVTSLLWEFFQLIQCGNQYWLQKIPREGKSLKVYVGRYVCDLIWYGFDAYEIVGKGIM